MSEQPISPTTPIHVAFAARLESWYPDTNPAGPRCRTCGLRPMTRTAWCIGCGASV